MAATVVGEARTVKRESEKILCCVRKAGGKIRMGKVLRSMLFVVRIFLFLVNFHDKR